MSTYRSSRNGQTASPRRPDGYERRPGASEHPQGRRSGSLGRVPDQLARAAINTARETREQPRPRLPVALLGPIAQQVDMYTTDDWSQDLDRSSPLFADNVVRAAFGSRAPYMGSLLAIVRRNDIADRPGASEAERTWHQRRLDTYIFALAPESYGYSAADGPLLMFANGNHVERMLANNSGAGLAQPVPGEDMPILGRDDVEFMGQGRRFGVYVSDYDLPTVIDMSGQGVTVISRSPGQPVPTPYLGLDVRSGVTDNWLNSPHRSGGTVPLARQSEDTERFRRIQ